VATDSSNEPWTPRIGDEPRWQSVTVDVRATSPQWTSGDGDGAPWTRLVVADIAMVADSSGGQCSLRVDGEEPTTTLGGCGLQLGPSPMGGASVDLRPWGGARKLQHSTGKHLARSPSFSGAQVR
jgi:hypothetical protein